jgi:hypothetical protein
MFETKIPVFALDNANKPLERGFKKSLMENLIGKEKERA